MRKLKSVFKGLSIAVTVLLAVLLVSNIYTILMRTFTDEKNPKFFGFSSAVIISGSMSGTIEVNDLVICHEKNDYNVGDIITYVSESGSLITHRIVSESDAGFITQGDANNTPDRTPVCEGDIVGKVVCTVPGIGSLIEFMRTPLGLMCIVFMGLLILAFPSIAEYFEKYRESESPKNGGNNDGSGNQDSEKENS